MKNPIPKRRLTLGYNMVHIISYDSILYGTDGAGQNEMLEVQKLVDALYKRFKHSFKSNEPKLIAVIGLGPKH